MARSSRSRSEIGELWAHRNDPAFLRNAGSAGGFRGAVMRLFAGGAGLMGQLEQKLGEAKSFFLGVFQQLGNAIGNAVAYLQSTTFFGWLGRILGPVQHWFSGVVEWATSTSPTSNRC